MDDLGIASGRYLARHNYDGRYTDKSTAVILWGARVDVLQTSSPLDLNEEELGDLVRVSLTTGDLDGDGYRELIATGQPLSDLAYFLMEGNYTTPSRQAGNTTRTITTYIYDQQQGLLINYSGAHKPLDGQYVTNQNGDTAWQSANGFDDHYYSMPVMRTNAAVLRLTGHSYPYLHLDSCLYEFTEGQATLKMALDDEKYDGEKTMELIYSDLSAVSFPKTWCAVSGIESPEMSYYAEHGAVSGDINGEGTDLLAASFYSHSSYGVSTAAAYHRSALSTLGAAEDGRLRHTYFTYHTSFAFHNEQKKRVGCAVAVMLDTDMDTTLIEYTGRHYLTYTDPKVLAVIAAAPYFGDVDEVTGYDYAWQNTTSYSTMCGEGHGEHTAVDLEAGAWFEATVGMAGDQAKFSTAALFTLEWIDATSTTTEYTLSFETSQDEDAVAFFSIPIENYVYNIHTPDGQGGYSVTEEIIIRQFTPCYQVLNLAYYESIRGNYSTLPAVAGEAITSTPGDPASYPASASGYDVIAQWNNNPAGVSFGNGAITQEITITKEDTYEFNLGAALDFTAGGGSGFQSDILQAKGELMGGIQFSMNPSGGWTEINLEGTTFTGTVTNIPLEFQDYGYYYSWKLFAYNHTFTDGKGNTNSVPVVSYIVGDVSEPPALPEDFQQDFDRSTTDKNVLTWTYDFPFDKFRIYGRRLSGDRGDPL